MKTKNLKIIMLLVFTVAVCMTAVVGCKDRPEKATYTLSYSVSGGGRIEGETLQSIAKYADGTVVSAIADDGYKFAGWSDGVKTWQRQDKVVTSNKSVTAEFVPLEYYTLSYTAGAGGRIEGETEQSVLEGSDGKTVTAVAEKGYKFAGWSDGSASAERQDITVKEPEYPLATISAFLPITCLTKSHNN